MKKLLACVLVIILALSMSFVTAFAAESPEANGIVSGVTATDENGDDASVELIKIDGKVTNYFQEGLKKLKKDEGYKNLKVVAQYKVKVIGDPKFDLDVVLDVLGVSDASKVYLLVNNGDVSVIKPEIEDGKIKFALEDDVKSLAIVADSKTAVNVEKENDVLSPQTADVTPFVAVIALVSLVTIAVLPKKIKA